MICMIHHLLSAYLLVNPFVPFSAHEFFFSTFIFRLQFDSPPLYASILFFVLILYL